MIKIFYIFILLFCHLIASDKIEANVSIEYWLSEETRIFSIDNVLVLEIEDDTINISPINWLGDILLAESIEYENQSFQENSIFNRMLLGMKIPKEDSWIEDYNLLDDKKIKVRYLFSSEEDSLRLYRMDIKEINKDSDDNKINNVILDNDVIMIWTNLNKEIQKIRFKYNGSNFLIKLNEEYTPILIKRFIFKRMCCSNLKLGSSKSTNR